MYCLNNPVNYFDPTGEIAITTVILIASIVAGVVAAGYTAYVEYEAGCDTVQIIGDSLCTGLAVFSIAYTAGMSLYQVYQNFCYLNGLTPVANIGNSTVSSPSIPNQLSTQTNPLQTITYTDKVKAQMQQGDYHAFPSIVDNYGSHGVQTTFQGGDGNMYNKLSISGSYDGKDGFFVYIWDEMGQCNHRLFEVS